MRMNSEESIKLGRKLFANYGGDWEAVLSAGTSREDGVIVVPMTPKNDNKTSKNANLTPSKVG